MKNKFFLAILFLSTFLALSLTKSDSISVNGVILDEQGTPLIGASILEKGTTNGTTSDLNGDFSLAVYSAKSILEISYTGYLPNEIVVDATQKMRIILKANPVGLDELVITEATNATTVEKAQEIEKERKKSRWSNLMEQTSTQTESTTDMKLMRTPSFAPSQSKIAACGRPPHSPPPGDNSTVYNTEDYAHIAENRFFEVKETPLSTFSIDVDAASYSNMRRFIKNGQQPPVDAIRIEEMVNYFDYAYPAPQSEHPFNVVTEMSDCPWNAENRLVHIGLQGKNIPMEELPNSNLVFLIDASGSMSSANKLPLLQASFKLLTDQLRPEDKVAIVVYAGAAGLVLPATKGSDKQKIKEAITQLQAGGSTAGGAGIQLAYKIAHENFIEGGNNRVILATDGDFNVGASSDSELVRMIEKERESNIFLTVLGFGMGNYKDNKMQQLANKGNGNHAYIDDISEAKKVLVNEFGGTLFTIAKDVKLQIEFNPSLVKGYRLIGYENRLLNKEDFNDDKKDAGELGAGHTVTALYEIIPVGVNSSYLSSVDPLKYQKPTPQKDKKHSDEMMTIKLRYKQPKSTKSRLIEQPVRDAHRSLDTSSDNFRWSAAVAEFGLLLRNSEYKGKANYAQAIDLAKGAKGSDLNGYRQELINMLEVMEGLQDNTVVKK